MRFEPIQPPAHEPDTRQAPNLAWLLATNADALEEISAQRAEFEQLVEEQDAELEGYCPDCNGNGDTASGRQCKRCHGSGEWANYAAADDVYDPRAWGDQ